MTQLHKMDCGDFSLTTRIIAADDALDKADVALVAAIAAIERLLPPDERAITSVKEARKASTQISLARQSLAEMGATRFSPKPRI